MIDKIVCTQSAINSEPFTERCPICGEPFVRDVLCATDITEGTCHAACLEGVPCVDLQTGEPIDGVPDTFPWEPDRPAA